MLFNATTKVYSFKVVVVFFYNDLQYIYSGSQTLLSVGYIDLCHFSFNSMLRGLYRFAACFIVALFIEEALPAVWHVLIFIQERIPSSLQHNGDCLRKLKWNLQLLLIFLRQCPAEPYVERRPQCTVLCMYLLKTQEFHC